MMKAYMVYCKKKFLIGFDSALMVYQATMAWYQDVRIIQHALYNSTAL
jgi:hypothetical protein